MDETETRGTGQDFGNLAEIPKIATVVLIDRHIHPLTLKSMLVKLICH